MPKPTELYTLNESIVLHVNYISIKVFKKMYNMYINYYRERKTGIIYS